MIAHRIQLKATPAQVSYFAKACGAARFTWNWGLDEWQRQCQCGVKPNAAALKKLFNGLKYREFPWLHEVHRDSHSEPFANLQDAFVRFFKKQNRYPRFKKKGKCRDSFYVACDKLKVAGHNVRLPVIGCVKMTK